DLELREGTNSGGYPRGANVYAVTRPSLLTLSRLLVNELMPTIWCNSFGASGIWYRRNCVNDVVLCMNQRVRNHCMSSSKFIRSPLRNTVTGIFSPGILRWSR